MIPYGWLTERSAGRALFVQSKQIVWPVCGLILSPPPSFLSPHANAPFFFLTPLVCVPIHSSASLSPVAYLQISSSLAMEEVYGELATLGGTHEVAKVHGAQLAASRRCDAPSSGGSPVLQAATTVSDGLLRLTIVATLFCCNRPVKSSGIYTSPPLYTLMET